jgi:hypothetical protein
MNPLPSLDLKTFLRSQKSSRSRNSLWIAVDTPTKLYLVVHYTPAISFLRKQTSWLSSLAAKKIRVRPLMACKILLRQPPTTFLKATPFKGDYRAI